MPLMRLDGRPSATVSWRGRGVSGTAACAGHDSMRMPAATKPRSPVASMPLSGFPSPGARLGEAAACDASPRCRPGLQRSVAAIAPSRSPALRLESPPWTRLPGTPWSHPMSRTCILACCLALLGLPPRGWPRSRRPSARPGAYARAVRGRTRRVLAGAGHGLGQHRHAGVRPRRLDTARSSTCRCRCSAWTWAMRNGTSAVLADQPARRRSTSAGAFRFQHGRTGRRRPRQGLRRADPARRDPPAVHGRHPQRAQAPSAAAVPPHRRVSPPRPRSAAPSSASTAWKNVIGDSVELRIEAEAVRGRGRPTDADGRAASRRPRTPADPTQPTQRTCHTRTRTNPPPEPTP